MSTPEPKRRASGRTVGEEVTREESRELHRQAPDEILPEERERLFRTPGLQQMRTDWQGEDATVIARVTATVDQAVSTAFGDAYHIMNDLFTIIRRPVLDPRTHQPLLDHLGFVQWAQTETGEYIEDWSLLGRVQQRDFLFRITTTIFSLMQRRTDARAESMYAKAVWEEQFARGFESLPAITATRPTVDDRTQRARLVASDARFFALYKLHYFWRAQDIIDALQLLDQRLKDIYTAAI